MFFNNLQKHKKIKLETKGKTTPMAKFSRGYINAYSEVRDKAFSLEEKKHIVNNEFKSAKNGDPYAKGYVSSLADYAKEQSKKGLNIYGQKRR